MRIGCGKPTLLRGLGGSGDPYGCRAGPSESRAGRLRCCGWRPSHSGYDLRPRARWFRRRLVLERGRRPAEGGRTSRRGDRAVAERGDHRQHLGDPAADAEAVRRTVERVGEPVVLVGHPRRDGDHRTRRSSRGRPQRLPRRVLAPAGAVGDGPALGGAAADLDGAPRRRNAQGHRRSGAPPADAVRRRRRAPRLRQPASLLPQSISSVTAPSTAPDRGHPTTYIICEEDQALPPAAQEQLATAADHRARPPSSHQAMTSMPEALADTLGHVHVPAAA